MSVCSEERAISHICVFLRAYKHIYISIYIYIYIYSIFVSYYFFIFYLLSPCFVIHLHRLSSVPLVRRSVDLLTARRLAFLFENKRCRSSTFFQHIFNIFSKFVSIWSIRWSSIVEVWILQAFSVKLVASPIKKFRLNVVISPK